MDSYLFITIIIALSIILGYLFTKLKIMKVNYLINKDEDEIDETTGKSKLQDVKDNYGKYLSLLAPFGISWGLTGLLITIGLLNAWVDDAGIIEPLLLGWIIISGAILAILPVLILLNNIELPESLDDLIHSKLALTLFIVDLVGIILASIILSLPAFGVILLSLLSIPALISAWFAGEFYAVFSIRQFYKMKGWDYIEGKAADAGWKGKLDRLLSTIGFILTILAPILALNSLISIFSKEEVQSQGGPIGSSTGSFFPPIVQNILVFILLLGPLISIATQPAGFLELTLNSEIYNTLAKFDWEEFNRKSIRAKDVITLNPYPRRVMAGILAIFLSFIIYVALLAVGGLIKGNGLTMDAGLSSMSEALKFIEVPVLLIVLFTILRDLREEREVIDIANLGMKEQRDVTGWIFWCLQHIFAGDYDLVEANLDKLLENDLTAKNHRLHFFKGLIIALMNDNAGAESYFRKSIELNPRYSDSHMELGVVTYFQGRYQEALEHLEQAKSLQPRSKLIWYNMGRVYDVLEQSEKAIECYKTAIKLNPKDAKIWANLGRTFISVDNLDEGIRCTKKALELDPNDYIAKVNLAVSYRQKGEISKILEIEDDLLENHGEITEVLQSVAHNRTLMGQITGAHDIYKTIVSKGMLNPFNVQGLSLVYSQLGLGEELIAILSKHVEKYPDDLHGKLLFGQALQNAGRFEESIAPLQEYINNNEAVIEGFVKLSASFGNLGRYEDSLGVLQKAGELFPVHKDIQYNLGITKALLGRKDFDKHFKMAIKLHEGEFNIYYMSMWMQSAIKNTVINESWIQDVKKDLQINDALIYLCLGVAYQGQQQIEKGIEYLHQAAITQPDSFTSYELGMQFLELEDFERSRDMFLRAYEDRKDVGVYANLAFSYLRLNEVEESMKYFEEGHKAFPDDDTILSNIIQVYLAIKAYAEAIPYLDKALYVQEGNYSMRYQLATCYALTGDAERAITEYDYARRLALAADDDEMIANIDEMIGYLTQSGDSEEPSE
ncbi:MAG: tetratricopeptide repeat protein [Candidatus Heimdallarchaeota archaeon]|nr:tetratricopeptide repeat protein [Candidatus Heimdallarchaeota archaeon]